MRGRGVGMTEADALRFMHKLVVEEFIEEKLYRLANIDTIISYVEVTQKGKDFVSGKSRCRVNQCIFTKLYFSKLFIK